MVEDRSGGGRGYERGENVVVYLGVGGWAKRVFKGDNWMEEICFIVVDVIIKR